MEIKNTDYLKLELPLQTDYYDVDIVNGNNTKIDAGVKKKLDSGGYLGDAEDLNNSISLKEDKFSKKDGFNKPFGTDENTVLEGQKIVENYGGPYGGSVAKAGNKWIGQFYSDPASGRIFQCTTNNILTYIDLGYYKDATHWGISKKLDELYKTETISLNGVSMKKVTIGNYVRIFGLTATNTNINITGHMSYWINTIAIHAGTVATVNIIAYLPLCTSTNVHLASSQGVAAQCYMTIEGFL